MSNVSHGKPLPVAAYKHTALLRKTKEPEAERLPESASGA